MSSLLNSLNEEQRAAAAQIQGPVMIIAGAGSGKTRTLTYRIAHIMEEGVEPFHILSLTFTNKAAREMRERISQLIGPEAHALWMGTFHSVFAKILRVEAAQLGYTSSFAIYNTEDVKSLLKSIVKELNLDPKEYTASFVLNRISAAKSNLISADDYLQSVEIRGQDRQAHKPMIGEIYQIYSERLRRSSAMDFDDLLFNMNVLLRDFPETLYKYQKRFQYILVDEYQDTNFAQYLILKKLAAQHENICVVGDDAQSIYSFRGANIQNILNFKSDYPSAQTYKLEQNYRSTQTIVGLANQIIKKNKDQITKEIWTENESGEKVQILKAMSDVEEGLMVVRSIFEVLHTERLPYKDFAILYRTNNQSRSLEDALRRSNIPYRIYGGMSFYDRKEIKDILAYFRWVVNLNDDEALLRCINYPARGIGATTLDRIRIIANEHKISLWEVIKNIHNPEIIINAGTKSKIHQVATMIESLHVQVATTDAFDLAQKIWFASGIAAEFKAENTPESQVRIQNAEELLNAVKDFCEKDQTVFDDETGELSRSENVPTLDVFLQEISLLTDADKHEDDDDNQVTLMTIHAAKGLEFKQVYVVGLEENLFPSAMSLTSRADIEEERRLFYVAVTRSEKKLTLSFATSRFRWGQHTFCEPSRFLEELDMHYIANPEILAHRTIGGFGFTQGQFNSFDTLGEEFAAKRIESKEKGELGFNPKSKKQFGLKSKESDDLGFTKKQTQEQGTQPTPIAKESPKNLRKISSLAKEALLAASTVKGTISSPIGATLAQGSKVQHSKFGQGIVLAIEGEGPNQKAIVQFEAPAGIKNLLTAFAKLEILE
ncbi:MAG: 3'-5' exonuclease [Bacteroidales bacterium]